MWPPGCDYPIATTRLRRQFDSKGQRWEDSTRRKRSIDHDYERSIYEDFLNCLSFLLIYCINFVNSKKCTKMLKKDRRRPDRTEHEDREHNSEESGGVCVDQIHNLPRFLQSRNFWLHSSKQIHYTNYPENSCCNKHYSKLLKYCHIHWLLLIGLEKSLFSWI